VKGFLIATVADYGFSMSGHLEELAVAEEGQGGGLGRMLVAACENWLRGVGVETVFVSSLETATSFYELLGYQRCIGPWLFHRLEDGERPELRTP
jgi:N-acetylglutamate synthase-like GNAT family acetyltransferase